MPKNKKKKKNFDRYKDKHLKLADSLPYTGTATYEISRLDSIYLTPLPVLETSWIKLDSATDCNITAEPLKIDAYLWILRCSWW